MQKFKVKIKRDKKVQPERRRNNSLSFCCKVAFIISLFSWGLLTPMYAYDHADSVDETWQNTLTVKGRVSDAEGNPVPGVTVKLKGSVKGTTTDIDGNYSLAGVKEGSTLEFSFIGYITVEKVVKGKTLNIILYEDTQTLDEVEVVAFGTQKKESVIGAISTVKVAELKVPTSNLTNALAGRVAGVISYQRTGEPGVDDSDFFVR